VSVPALSTSRRAPRLENEQIKQFEQAGFLILPGFLPDDLVARLKPEVDRWVDAGLRAQSIACAVNPGTHGVPAIMEVDLPAHGELLTYPPLLRSIERLAGMRLVFHHLHSDRHAPDLPGKAWHHDYEQGVQSRRAYAMVHALHYLDGLDAGMAGLAVLPGSHRVVAEKDAHAQWGTEPLAGEACIEDLPPGSTVLVHAALFHARRPRPQHLEQQPQGRPRYCIDASYCQAGTRWPPVRPYWREMLARARRNGLASPEWPELFSDRHFSEYAKPE
jgi:hypothetical protein